jgi:hypothetical protein
MTRLCVPLALFLALAAPAFADECRIPGTEKISDYSILHETLIGKGFMPVSDMHPRCMVAKAFNGCHFDWKMPTGQPFSIALPFNHKPPFVANYPCPKEFSR